MSSLTTSRLFRLSGLLLATASCVRYEYVNELDVPGLCPGKAPFVQPGGPLVLAYDAPSGEIVGRVIRSGTIQPLHGAHVSLRGPDTSTVLTDTTGAFAFRAITPGRRELLTRQIGFAMRRDTVTIQADAGVTVTIPLEPATTDGPCSGFMMLGIPKPWWKLW